MSHFGGAVLIEECRMFQCGEELCEWRPVEPLWTVTHLADPSWLQHNMRCEPSFCTTSVVIPSMGLWSCLWPSALTSQQRQQTLNNSLGWLEPCGSVPFAFQSHVDTWMSMELWKYPPHTHTPIQTTWAQLEPWQEETLDLNILSTWVNHQHYLRWYECDTNVLLDYCATLHSGT